jgi:integrase
MDTIEIGQINDDMVDELEKMLRDGVPGRCEQKRRDGSSYARPRSEQTVARFMCCLRTILNFAKKKGMLTAVPFVEVNLKFKSGGGNALTEDEFKRLYRELPEHLQIPLQFAVGSGLRTEALLALRWKHIRKDLKQYWVPAEFVKGEADDLGLPISDFAREALLAARAYAPPMSDEDHVFQYRDPTLTSLTEAQMRGVARELIVRPGALGQRNMLSQRDLRRALMRKFGRVGSTARRQFICQDETEAYLRRGSKVARVNQKASAAPIRTTRPLLSLGGTAFEKAVARANIQGKHVTPHVMRHTFATWLLNNGITEHALMALGNWKTLAMMRHYARLKGDHLAQAVALLPTFELEKKGAIRLVKSGNQAPDSGSPATKSATEE